MNEFTPEQIQELFNHSLVILDVVAYSFLAFGLLICILYFIKGIKQDKFAESLNDHDKAVLFSYRSVRIFKKKNETKKDITKQQN